MKSEQTKKVTRKNAGREGAPPAVMFEAMTRSVVGLRERVCSLGGLVAQNRETVRRSQTNSRSRPERPVFVCASAWRRRRRNAPSSTWLDKTNRRVRGPPVSSDPACAVRWQFSFTTVRSMRQWPDEAHARSLICSRSRGCTVLYQYVILGMHTH